MYQEDSFKVIKNNNIIAEPKNDKELLVLSSSGDIIELNETATYILNNCDGKGICEIATLLFEVCNNKEDINFDELYSDVLQIIDDMRRFGFVTFVEEGS